MVKPSLKYYACGRTSHELSMIYKNHPKEHRTFPAGAFLYQKIDGSSVIFDTGYAPNMKKTGLLGKLYSKILPPVIQEHETIDQQLRRDGIDPESIGTVVLSHLHPDHIGGVRYFEGAHFVLSKSAMDTLMKPRLRDGVMPRLLPKWFEDAEKTILDSTQLYKTEYDGVAAYDLLGDGSYLIVDLPGHANGHIGALIESKVLLAGDASWGTDLLPYSNGLKPLPKLITHNFEAYVETARNLQALGDSGIRLCFSHDQYQKEELFG